MTLNYSLNQNDFLQHQLYLASKTSRIKKQRRKSWLLVTFVFLVLSFLFFQNDNRLLMYYFLSVGTISLIFYPFYLRRHYKKHYQKYINETYKNRFDNTCTITLNESNIETIDKTGESKINLSEIDEVVETGDYFYLRMKSGGSLIISKVKIENPENVRQELISLAGRLNINYKPELDWKWK